MLVEVVVFVVGLSKERSVRGSELGWVDYGWEFIFRSRSDHEGFMLWMELGKGGACGAVRTQESSCVGKALGGKYVVYNCPLARRLALASTVSAVS